MPYIAHFSLNPPRSHPIPFDVPAVRFAKDIDLGAPVTCFVGDNGMGKSTLTPAGPRAAGPAARALLQHQRIQPLELLEGFVRGNEPVSSRNGKGCEIGIHPAFGGGGIHLGKG